MEKATQNQSKINPDDLITLRRVIYQSLQLSFQRGRLVPNPFVASVTNGVPPQFGPNLDIIAKVSAAYEQAIVDEEKNRDNISKAHKNMLKDAIYFLYAYNRTKEAGYWFEYVRKKYPEAFPPNQTLDEYAVSRVQEEVGDTSKDRTQAMLEGLFASSFYSLAIDEDERSAVLEGLAKQIWTRFENKIAGGETRVGLPPLPEIKKVVLDRLLDHEHGFVPDMRAILRTKLRLPAEGTPAPAPTNAPPATAVLK